MEPDIPFPPEHVCVETRMPIELQLHLNCTSLTETKDLHYTPFITISFSRIFFWQQLSHLVFNLPFLNVHQLQLQHNAQLNMNMYTYLKHSTFDVFFTEILEIILVQREMNGQLSRIVVDVVQVVNVTNWGNYLAIFILPTKLKFSQEDTYIYSQSSRVSSLQRLKKFSTDYSINSPSSGKLNRLRYFGISPLQFS